MGTPDFYMAREIADRRIFCDRWPLLGARSREPNAPGEESDSIRSAAAVAHGKLRKLQGYTPGMLVHDSRILQVALFGTLQSI